MTDEFGKMVSAAHTASQMYVPSFLSTEVQPPASILEGGEFVEVEGARVCPRQSVNRARRNTPKYVSISEIMALNVQISILKN